MEGGYLDPNSVAQVPNPQDTLGLPSNEYLWESVLNMDHVERRAQPYRKPGQKHGLGFNKERLLAWPYAVSRTYEWPKFNHFGLLTFALALQVFYVINHPFWGRLASSNAITRELTQAGLMGETEMVIEGGFGGFCWWFWKKWRRRFFIGLSEPNTLRFGKIPTPGKIAFCQITVLEVQFFVRQYWYVRRYDEMAVYLWIEKLCGGHSWESNRFRNDLWYQVNEGHRIMGEVLQHIIGNGLLTRPRPLAHFRTRSMIECVWQTPSWVDRGWYGFKETPMALADPVLTEFLKGSLYGGSRGNGGFRMTQNGVLVPHNDPRNPWRRVDLQPGGPSDHTAGYRRNRYTSRYLRGPRFAPGDNHERFDRYKLGMRAHSKKAINALLETQMYGDS